MRRPNEPLHEQTPHITPPRIPRPPQHLLQKPPIRLHSTQQLRLLTNLHVRAPPMTDHPPRQKLIISTVQMVLPQPIIVREPVKELGILEDDGAIGGGTSGETGQATIDVRRRCDLDISDAETHSGEDFPDSHSIAHRLHPLTRTHTPNLLILKTSQHIRNQRRRPNRIIVREEDNIRRRILDPMGHLQSLVSERDGQNADTFGVDGIGKVLERPEHLLFGDDDDFFGFADEPGVSGFFELFAGVDGGDDDGDIFGGDVGWIVG